MHAVWSWLRELVELDREVSAEEGARALTDAGLEVESITHIGTDFSGVVVGEVVGKRKHPEADRLTLVDMIDRPGGPVIEVVCGAPNVPEPGGRVLWAQPGAVLPGNMKIGKRKIKGVESAGMLCAEDELGLGDDHDGIIVLSAADVLSGSGDLLGDPNAIQRLGLRDTVLEIGVPANRPDALGHLGLARELVALFGGRMAPVFATIEKDLEALLDEGLLAEDLVSVELEDTQGCPRYVARVIDGVRMAPAPRWMQQRLRAVGIRPLSNLVDITNYVMFELGQPLHAFDYASVGGGRIRVRRAREGECITTLDDVERPLVQEDLLICDERGPVALAGIMGGANSEVTERTTRVLLEAASFAPEPIRHTARRLGLHSEASHRFERGVDPNIAHIASARTAQLLARLGGGRIAGGVVDVYPRPVEPVRVALRASRTRLLTGVELDRAQIAQTLARQGLETAVDAADPDRLQVTCPTYRPDLVREVDLIEEVIRIHGLDKVPATLPAKPVPLTRNMDSRPALIRRALVAAGMSEAITFGFTSLKRVESLGLPETDRRARPIALRNPMSAEQAVMRTSLLPNLLAAVVRNRSFGIADIALFEIGSVFLATQAGALPDEPMMVAGVLAGHRPGWLKDEDKVDVFDIKGSVEAALDALLGPKAAAVRFEADDSVPYMHPGVCARIVLPDGEHLGHFGEIHPVTRKALGLEQPCFGFELALSAFPTPQPAQMRAIPRYPSTARDISLFMDEGIPAARVRDLIGEAADPLVEQVTVLEDYRDPANVPVGQKGMLWSITYRSSEGTLTDAQVDAAHEAIVARLLEKIPAQRR